MSQRTFCRGNALAYQPCSVQQATQTVRSYIANSTAIPQETLEGLHKVLGSLEGVPDQPVTQLAHAEHPGRGRHQHQQQQQAAASSPQPSHKRKAEHQGDLEGAENVKAVAGAAPGSKAKKKQKAQDGREEQQQQQAAHKHSKPDSAGKKKQQQQPENPAKVPQSNGLGTSTAALAEQTVQHHPTAKKQKGSQLNGAATPAAAATPTQSTLAAADGHAGQDTQGDKKHKKDKKEKKKKDKQKHSGGQ